MIIVLKKGLNMSSTTEAEEVMQRSYSEYVTIQNQLCDYYTNAVEQVSSDTGSSVQ